MKRVGILWGVWAVAAGLLLAGGERLSEARYKPAADLLKVQFKRPAVSSSLAQALADLGQLAEVKIVVDWPGLLRTGVKPDAKVALAASEATLEQLLEQVLAAAAVKGHPLAWRIVDGAVLVTTQARLLQRDAVVPMSAVVGTTTRPAGAPAAATSRPAPPATAVMIPPRTRFDKAPLGEVIDFFRKLSGVDFQVHYTALETAGIRKDTPVTLQVSNVSIAKALDLVTEELSSGRGKLDSVYWIVDEGIVTLTTGAVLDTKLLSRTIDVGDLLMAVQDHEGPTLNLNLSNAANSGTNNTSTGGVYTTDNTTNRNATEAAAAVREAAQAKLAKIVQDTIGPDMWQPQGKGSISFVRNTMIISQTRLGFLLMQKAGGVR